MSRLAPYQRPGIKISTPCGRLEVQYYDDLQAPDEQTTADELALHGAPNLTRAPGGAYVLHICNPRVDGFELKELRVMVLSTPLDKLKVTLLELPRYAETMHLQRSYDQEMRLLRRKGLFPVGDEQWMRSYKDVQSRRCRDREWRLERKKMGYEQLTRAFLAAVRAELCSLEPEQGREGRPDIVVIGANRGDKSRARKAAGCVNSAMIDSMYETAIDSIHELG